MLPLTGAQAVVVGHNRAQHAMDAAHEESLGLADTHRGPVTVTQEPHHPTHGHRDNIRRLVVRVGAGLAEGSDRSHDEGRV